MTKKVMEIKDFKAAEKAMARLAQLEGYVAEVDAASKQELTAMQAKREKTLSKQLATIFELRAALEAFAHAKQADICRDGKKSWETSFGGMGWKASTSLEPMDGYTQDQVLAALRKAKKLDAIKVDENIVKGALKNLDEKELKKYGLHNVSKENFFIKTKPVERSMQ